MKKPYIEGHFVVVTNSNSNAEACILIDNICATWYSEAHKSGMIMCSGGGTYPVKELPIEIMKAINTYKEPKNELRPKSKNKPTAKK